MSGNKFPWKKLRDFRDQFRIRDVQRFKRKTHAQEKRLVDRQQTSSLQAGVKLSCTLWKCKMDKNIFGNKLILYMIPLHLGFKALVSNWWAQRIY
jgi:hypothetical protein